VYNSAVYFRHFLDTLAEGKLTLMIEPKTAEEQTETTVELTPFEREYKYLQQNEEDSREWIHIDPKTKVLTTFRECLMQEIVPNETKPL